MLYNVYLHPPKHIRLEGQLERTNVCVRRPDSDFDIKKEKKKENRTVKVDALFCLSKEDTSNNRLLEINGPKCVKFD